MIALSPQDEIYTRLASEYRNIIRSTVNCDKPGDFIGKSNVTHIARDVGELHEPDDTGGGVENRKDTCDCVQNQDATSGFVGVHEDASGYTRPPKDDGECAQCGYYKGFLVKKTSRQLSITTTPTRDGEYCRYVLYTTCICRHSSHNREILVFIPVAHNIEDVEPFLPHVFVPSDVS